MDEDKSTEAPEKTIEYGPMAVIAGDTSKPAGSGGRFEKFKKKPVILLAILLLLAVLAAAYFLIFAGKSSSDTPPEISRIGVAPTVVDGEVAHLSGSGERTLTVNSILSEGDSVRTADDGRVVLTFDDGSALRLDASTEVRLVSLAANDVRVEHLEGAAYSRVVASGRSYSVDVDGTAFMAEGTAYTTHNTATTKGVQVVQSSVKVAGADESVEEGKQYFKAHQNSELIDKQTDINLEEFKNNSFVLWNMEQDEKSDLFKDKLGLFNKIKETSGGQSAEEDVNQSGSGIKLVAKNDNKGTVLSWSVSGLDASGGFMIVRSKKSSAPVYGQDESIKVDHKTRSYTWKSDKEGVFWYRVCAYKDKKTCVSYSNAVEMKAVYVAPEPVVSGSVTLTGPAEDGRTISWAGFGGTAPHGFKVLISTGVNPTYPSHAVDLVSGTSYTVKDKYLQSGVNYVRVCKYTAGSQTEKCVDYSNSVTLTKNP